MSEIDKKSDQCSEKEGSNGRVEFPGINIGDKFGNISEFLTQTNCKRVQMFNCKTENSVPWRVLKRDTQYKQPMLTLSQSTIIYIHMACGCGRKKQSEKVIKRKIK